MLLKIPVYKRLRDFCLSLARGQAGSPMINKAISIGRVQIKPDDRIPLDDLSARQFTVFYQIGIELARTAAIKQIQSSADTNAVDFCRSAMLAAACRGRRRCGRQRRRSQFAASEDEKRLDARTFHLTRGPLSARCPASAAVTRGGPGPITRDRAHGSDTAARFRRPSLRI